MTLVAIEMLSLFISYYFACATGLTTSTMRSTKLLMV